MGRHWRYRGQPIRMVRVRRTTSVMIVLAVAALAGLGGSQTQAATPTKNVLTIGAVLSLTGGGNVYGPQQAKAAELAVAQINAAGGIGGVPVRLVILDDKSDPSAGKAAMRQLIQKDDAIAILGPTLSLVAVAADPIADSLKTPVVAISNTANGIVGKCAYPCTWIWRDSLGESIAVPANISEYTVEAHPSSAAILYASGDVLGSDEAE